MTCPLLLKHKRKGERQRQTPFHPPQKKKKDAVYKKYEELMKTPHQTDKSAQSAQNLAKVYLEVCKPLGKLVPSSEL